VIAANRIRGFPRPLERARHDGRQRNVVQTFHQPRHLRAPDVVQANPGGNAGEVMVDGVRQAVPDQKKGRHED
jgi:hypothetical protein